MGIRAFASLVVMPWEFFVDWLRALKWSKASPFASRAKRDYYDAILLAHTVEKGLSYSSLRLGFGGEKIDGLLSILDRIQIEHGNYAVEMACGALSEYISVHESASFDLGHRGLRISEFLARCSAAGVVSRGGSKLAHVFAPSSQDEADLLRNFLRSRISVRNFTDQAVPEDVLERVVRLSQAAPSQCNRQGVVAFCYQDKKKIVELLTLQGGAEGFKQDVSNLLIVAADQTAWSGCNARYQSHVDTSLFGHQFSLACLTEGLGSCTLNLAIGNAKEARIRKASGIPDNYRLAFMIVFGFPLQQQFKAPASERIDLSVVLVKG